MFLKRCPYFMRTLLNLRQFSHHCLHIHLFKPDAHIALRLQGPKHLDLCLQLLVSLLLLVHDHLMLPSHIVDFEVYKVPDVLIGDLELIVQIDVDVFHFTQWLRVNQRWLGRPTRLVLAQLVRVRVSHSQPILSNYKFLQEINTLFCYNFICLFNLIHTNLEACFHFEEVFITIILTCYTSNNSLFAPVS